MTSDPKAADVAGMLFDRRADWLRKYFPAGRVRGGVFELGDADGSPGTSLPIPLYRQPRLTDFAGGFAGDDLALLGHAIGAGNDMAAAYKEALAFLGLSDGQPSPPRAPPPKPPDQVPNDNRELAQDIWRRAGSVGLPGCPSEIYLRHRAISTWPQDVLRFEPECPFGRDTAPAIIAPINSSESGIVVGVWRIRLTPAGELVDRLGLGPTRTNCSRLYWPEDDEVAIAEGVEDALAFHELTGLPTWAALSAGNMAVLVLPAWLRRVVIVQDTDPPHPRTGRRPGPEAAQALARRLRAEGRGVEIVAAAAGKDANDVLVRRAAQ